MSVVLIKDKIPLAGTDTDSILTAVGMVLKHSGVVRFNVDARTSMIDFWRMPASEEEEALEIASPFREKLKEVQMEEYVPENNISSHEQLFEMFEMIEDAGCFPVFLLSGRILVELRKWISFPRRSSSLAGIPIIMNPDLMEDTILVCGAKTREAEPVDVAYVVKMTLP